MATVVLGISDPHWTERKPRSRKDRDWLGTIRQKLQKLLMLAERIQVDDEAGGKHLGAHAIQIAGDLFHVPAGPSISRRLDVMLTEELRKSPCPVYAIPGNHDLQNERMESLSNHPYGVLTASGTVQDLCWPKYVVVGDEPPVVLTGLPYMACGPGPWLSELAATRELLSLKEEITKQKGRPPYIVVMTHNHWGEREGQDEHLIQRTAKSLLIGTGIDVCHYGDPHTFDGVEWIQDVDHNIALVGPGAFIRGSLAEHDVTRKPMIVVMVFRTNQPPEIKMVPVPHLPVEEVFNLEQHKKEKQRKVTQDRFVSSMKTLTAEVRSVDKLLSGVEVQTSPRVLDIVRQHLQAAREGMEDLNAKD